MRERNSLESFNGYIQEVTLMTGLKIFMPKSGGRITTPKLLWEIIHDARSTSPSARLMLRRGTICSCSGGHQQFMKIT